MKRFLSIFWALVFALTASSQEEKKAPDYGDFTVDAQVRARGEFRTGLGTMSDGSESPSLLVGDRVRLAFGWERKNISLKITAQHTGQWQDGGQKNTNGSIALHEAWAKMTFGKGFFVQAGRQVLSYDDERLFGAHDWVSTGRAHDALRIGWENERHRLHAIVSVNQTADALDDVVAAKASSTPRLYKNMQTLWYHLGRSEAPFQISALVSNQGVGDISGSGVHYMQTFGAYATFAKRKFFSDAAFYYQLGNDRTGTSVSAFLLNINVGLQFTPKWSLSVGDDYLSGDDGTSAKNKAFNLLYGSYHKFFGAMDYFGYGSAPAYGLNDVHAVCKFRPGEKFNMSLGVRWLATPNPIMDYLKNYYTNHRNNFIYHLSDEEIAYWKPLKGGEHRFGQNLGTEVDLEASYRPWKYVAIDAGFSVLVGTETVQLLRSSDTGTFLSWGWVSFDVNPTIFSTKHRR